MNTATARHRISRGTPEHGGIILKLLSLLLLVVFIGALYVLRVPLLRAAGNAWVVDEAPVPSDAIVVLCDDNYAADRASRAAELYRAGWAPRVVASGRYVRPYASIGDLMQRDLVERGVPAEAVVRHVHHAGTTRDEAYVMRRLIAERGWRRVIVVTSNYHTRRARYIWRRVLPADVELRLVAARDSGFDPDNWWRSRWGWRHAFHELAGFGMAFWEMQDEEPAEAKLTAAPARQ